MGESFRYGRDKLSRASAVRLDSLQLLPRLVALLTVATQLIPLIMAARDATVRRVIQPHTPGRVVDDAAGLAFQVRG
jgi:hypothetical protein